LISLTVVIADIISTVEFDSTGNYLATGDKGGRVVLFERNEMVRKICLLAPPVSCQETKVPEEHLVLHTFETTILMPFFFLQKKGCEYKFYTEFQSHEPEFDYLKSLEIEEKINKIKWCRRQNAAHFLLSTNGINLSSASPLGG
jgi:serine/threonine-protein phosphatase 2A regulatory subunit B